MFFFFFFFFGFVFYKIATILVIWKPSDRDPVTAKVKGVSHNIQEKKSLSSVSELEQHMKLVYHACQFSTSRTFQSFKISM